MLEKQIVDKLCLISVFIILILFINYIYKNYTSRDTFLVVEDSKLYLQPKEKVAPAEIKYQIPVPANQLTNNQLDTLDTDILRNVRRLVNFSLTDELDFYQMYNIIKQLKDSNYTFTYNINASTDKYIIKPNEKLSELNTGAINNVNLELFTRIKLELMSAFNNLIIKNNYYLPYHPFDFFKIINSNLISYDGKNYTFTTRIAREGKYQQFTFYWEINVEQNDNTYNVKVNKLELTGIPIPKDIKFHKNQKTTIDKSENINKKTNKLQTLYDNLENDKSIQLNEKLKSDLKNRILKNINKESVNTISTEEDEDIDVMPYQDGSLLQDPSVKFIDQLERSDMSPNYFNLDSAAAKVEERRMNLAKDVYYNGHKCFGLVNGQSQELPQYKHKIFCESYHPEINQNGIWDAPCQVDTDCPFYKANKNYPNTFGGCNKSSGICEMPLGVTPLGFTKYAKIEPDCYNCNTLSENNKCCGKQANDVKMRISKAKSPDYIFKEDGALRAMYQDDLRALDLEAKPSI